jgi:hypothetical protein
LLNQFYSTENKVKSKGIREETDLIYSIVDTPDGNIGFGAKVAEKLYSRKAYTYSFWHYIYARFLKYFCYCCR